MIAYAVHDGNLSRALPTYACLPLAVALSLAAWGVLAAEAVDPKVQARVDFVRGADLVKDASWAEALAAFEASYARVPHSVTRFNMGVCERALGKLTRARVAFRGALEDPALPAALRTDADRFVTELNAAMVRVSVRLNETPIVALVDGSPLSLDKDGSFAAGLLPAGPPADGATGPGMSFVLVMDPGPHVLVAQRPGFRDLVHRTSTSRGEHLEWALTMQNAYGLLRISSDAPQSLVTIDGTRLGIAPIELRKLEGKYHVTITKVGFATYHNDVRIAPGSTVDVRARLQKDAVSFTKRWWFWTVAIATVGGIVATAVALTRPPSEVPQANGGTLGWVVRAR